MGRGITVRTAESSDLGWLVENDGHLDTGTLTAKVAASEVLVAEVDGERADCSGLTCSGRRCRSLHRCAWAVSSAELVWAGRLFMRCFALSSATGNESQPQAWHRAVGFNVCGELSGINDGGIADIGYRLPL
jgi:hypothetical protein